MSAALALPWEPLETHALAWITDRQLHVADNGSDCTVAALATVLHLDRRQVYRLRDRGAVDFDTAERCAIEIGRLLDDVWSDDDLEFAFVWSSIAPTVMRKMRAAAYRESCRLRDVQAP